MGIELDTRGIEGGGASEAEGARASEDLDGLDSATGLIAVAAGAGAIALGVAAFQQLSRYAEAKAEYDSHPARPEIERWGGAASQLSDAKRELDDYDYTTTTYIPMSSGKTTWLMPIYHHHHHSPDPDSAMRSIEAARQYLSSCSKGPSAAGELDRIGGEIAVKRYESAMDALGSLADQAKAQEASWIAQAQPTYDEMNGALGWGVASSVGAAAAAAGAGYAGWKWREGREG